MLLSTILKGVTKTNKFLYSGIIVVGGTIIATQAIHRILQHHKDEHVGNEDETNETEEDIVIEQPPSAPIEVEDQSTPDVDDTESNEGDTLTVLEWFNQANEGAMGHIKGLGASRAQAIVKHRPYASEEELLAASNGVGPTMLKRVEGYLNP